jgi:hypothetical protein
MLINNKSSLVNEVVAIKLTNGQEIITKLTAIEGDVYTVYCPYVLMLVRDPETGHPTVTFAPFSMGVDDKVSYDILRQHMVVAPQAARADAAKQYTQVTSGIEIVGAGQSGLAGL